MCVWADICGRCMGVTSHIYWGGAPEVFAGGTGHAHIALRRRKGRLSSDMSLICLFYFAPSVCARGMSTPFQRRQSREQLLQQPPRNILSQLVSSSLLLITLHFAVIQFNFIHSHFIASRSFVLLA